MLFAYQSHPNLGSGSSWDLTCIVIDFEPMVMLCSRLDRHTRGMRKLHLKFLAGIVIQDTKAVH